LVSKGRHYLQEGQKAKALCQEHDNLEIYLDEEEARSPSLLHISWHAPVPLPDKSFPTTQSQEISKVTRRNHIFVKFIYEWINA
jgi:hypothetical protein